MKYTIEERLNIGKQIYDNLISKYDASVKYGISLTTIRTYMRMYRDANHLPPKNKAKSMGNDITIVSTSTSTSADLAKYEMMTKEDLIKELVKARINEARLKKGYQVEGVGAEKVYIPLGSKNMK